MSEFEHRPQIPVALVVQHLKLIDGGRVDHGAKLSIHAIALHPPLEDPTKRCLFNVGLQFGHFDARHRQPLDHLSHAIDVLEARVHGDDEIHIEFS